MHRNPQNSRRQLVIQKYVPQQIQQHQPASSSTGPTSVVPQQMPHDQDSESKFCRIMDIAEEIIAEPGYDPEQFDVQLQERCISANLGGKHFRNSWVQYAGNVKKRWEKNGSKFATAADQRFADIKRKFDNSYCVPQTSGSNSASPTQHNAQASSNETMSRPRRGAQTEDNSRSSISNLSKGSRADLENVEDRSSNSNNEGNDSNNRSNRRQRTAAEATGPRSKRTRRNATAPHESPQTNQPARQRLDFLLPPMSTRPVAPQFSNLEPLQQIYIERFNEQQRENEVQNFIRNLLPPRDGFHGALSSSMPESGTTAENDEQNGSEKESSTKSDMISASDLDNNGPQVQPDHDDVHEQPEVSLSPSANPVANNETASAATGNQEQPEVSLSPSANPVANNETASAATGNQEQPEVSLSPSANPVANNETASAATGNQEQPEVSLSPSANPVANNETASAATGNQEQPEVSLSPSANPVANNETASAATGNQEQPEVSLSPSANPVANNETASAATGNQEQPEVSLSPSANPVANNETASAANENREHHQITDIMVRQIDALKDIMNKQLETLSKMNQK